ncbi:MAG: hypothetical protein WAN51_07620 [Alphaproteobacteria bacterium]
MSAGGAPQANWTWAKSGPSLIIVSDIDVYRSAYVLIEQHGADADIHAAMKADEFFAAGDLQAYMAWRRILRAIQYLASMKPPEDMKQHQD